MGQDGTAIVFKRRNPDLDATIFFDGEPIGCRVGETVAAALLAAGVCSTRVTPRLAAPRLPYCMMGVCFDCLMEIDGIGNRQACLTVVRDGMCVNRQTVVHGSAWA